jgi:hypothetical protein
MWSVRLSSTQREAMQGLIAAAVERDPGLQPLLEAVELARWDELPDASLPWEQVAALAREQGIGEADVVWDLACGMAARRAPLVVRRQLPAPAPAPDRPQP